MNADIEANTDLRGSIDWIARGQLTSQIYDHWSQAVYCANSAIGYNCRALGSKAVKRTDSKRSRQED